MIRVNSCSSFAVGQPVNFTNKQNNPCFKGVVGGSILAGTGLWMSRYMYNHGQMPNANTPGLLLSTLLMGCMIAFLFGGAAMSFFAKEHARKV